MSASWARTEYANELDGAQDKNSAKAITEMARRLILQRGFKRRARERSLSYFKPMQLA